MKTLIFDPNTESRDALRRSFASLECSVRSFADADEASRALAEISPEIVVLALDAPGGETLLNRVRGGADCDLFALVNGTELDRAVAAVAAGARDFLWRPVSPARVAQLVVAAALRRESDAAAEETRVRLARAQLRDTLPGRSPIWIGALSALERAAAGNGNALLTGESGTEKDAAALAMHRLSARGAGRFAYISEGESLELATRQAGHGTLFVPVIEATSAGFQEMLLKHLDGAYRTRFIIGTDEDPQDAVGAGRFLRGLYEGIVDNRVHLPPLREREEDVPLLARQLLEEIEPAMSFNLEAVDVLQTHAWPGNVRELSEVVRRAAALSGGPEIGPTTVRSVLGRPLPVRRERPRKAPVVRIAVGDSLADVERRLIQKTLAFARGNKKKTAALLKLSLKTIYNKIKEYGLEH
ncbi:MAG: sigma-54-dependent transcriptional regulator [Thermoanaerobaculia bacterium]